MTSNVGIDKNVVQKNVGFMNSNNNEDPRAMLKGYFKDEFINRIDEIVKFEPLSHSALIQIAKIKLSELCERIYSSGLELIINEEVYEYLAVKSKIKGFGARPLNRMITNMIENELAEMMMRGELIYGDKVRVCIANDKIQCHKVILALK